MMKWKASLLTLVLMGMGSFSGVSMAAENGAGFYLGLGGGWSGYWAGFIDSEYYIDDGSSVFVNSNSIDEQDVGYRIYAGYLFNRFIGIEAAYTDYGHIDFGAYEQKPESFSLMANGGYTFFDGQLRPFGLLGLGYLDSNQSRELFEESFFTIHAGIGVEYYPPVLKGVGIRVAFEGDFNTDSETADDGSGNISRKTFIKDYMLFYGGVQYKF